MPPTVGDTTDPSGTLRPNLPPQPTTGTHFEPLKCPKFDPVINLPASVDRSSPYAIWSLFFTSQTLETIIKNTNIQGQSWSNSRGVHARVWRTLDLPEMYAWLAISLYMGLHPENETRDYWRRSGPSLVCHTQVWQAIGQNRWHDIWRALSLSEFSTGSKRKTTTPFKKIELLSSYIFEVARQLWIPGRDLAVDELIERFSGRSSDITTIPNKPTPTGYKVWALAQRGYILSVIFHQNGKGPVDSSVPKDSKINPTQAVVVNLLNTLSNPPISPTLRYCVWLDNLFLSTTLFTYLRSLEYGSTGTCRTNSGICKEFVLLKKAEQAKPNLTLWGTIRQEPTIDNQVLQTAWKDNNIVLMLSTIHDYVTLDPILSKLQALQSQAGILLDSETIVRNRRRPKITSTAGKSVWAVFNNDVRKELPIPLVVDEYNHQMNAVDLADQLRSGNRGERRIYRGGWRALFRFLYTTVIVNSALLSTVPRARGLKLFRRLLVDQLFELAKSQGQLAKHRYLCPDLPSLASIPEHIKARREREQDCRGCALSGQSRVPSTKKRKALAKLSTNQEPPKKKPRSTVYGCKACDTPLCKEGPCWEAYHSQNRGTL